ncbi:peptidylprolyl isomerase [Flagellimonas iocasae]|uniref:peptidylprolyl isomerase n=1 Tax=Flagellimonas iocasae TaxID=2055905 RepID=A0ABW4XVX8_9FLAO
MKPFLFLLALLTVLNCKPKSEPVVENQPEPVKVELNTTKGLIVLELSDKTPLHRDNFIKIVNEGRLDSMLFHRVINDFVVQAGAYDSLKMAKMDSSDLKAVDYLVPAELDTSLFHKRGAISAARTDNVERGSAALSFAIVQRGPRSDSLITSDEKRINDWLQEYYFIHAEENKMWKDSLLSAENENNWRQFNVLKDTIRSLAKSFEFTPYVIPEHHREVYRTLGGNTHLDQNYTVFGEVISGMPVVDSIAAAEVNDRDRPLENIYIISAKVLE